MLIYFLSILLFLVGLYGVLTKRNLIKIIISLTLIEYSVFLLFVVKGYKNYGMIPVITPENINSYLYVDPLVQAMVITAIVIGFSTTLILLSFAVKVYKKFQTLDLEDLKTLKE